MELELRRSRAVEEVDMSLLEMRQMYQYYIIRHEAINTVIQTCTLTAGQRSMLLNALLNMEHKCNELHELFITYVSDLQPVVRQFTSVLFPFALPESDTGFPVDDDVDDVVMGDELDSDSELA